MKHKCIYGPPDPVYGSGTSCRTFDDEGRNLPCPLGQPPAEVLYADIPNAECAWND